MTDCEAHRGRPGGDAGQPPPEAWRYHFYFLSPEDYTVFFGRVRVRTFAGWRSGLMQALGA